MSMNNYFIYGYGFHCNCDDAKLIDFVKSHKNTFCKSETETKLYEKMLQYTEKEYDLEDFFKHYPCDATSIEGAGAVIANIMSRETNIRFIYCQPDENCDTPESVIFEESYPWQLNDVEKALTEETLANICKTYMNELGITNSPTYVNLAYDNMSNTL